jgi:hypothetical protein
MSEPDFEAMGWKLLDEYSTRYSSGDKDDATFIGEALRAAYNLAEADRLRAELATLWEQHEATMDSATEFMQQRERYRAALERIAASETCEVCDASWQENNVRIAKSALDPGMPAGVKR